MKTIAVFDKPYDSLFILLKDELQANSINYQISGEDGSAIQYMSVTFEIKVMIDEKDYDSALAIFNKLAALSKE